ncbi:hypothetical protein DYB35_004344 [Aphanomyces astaci]|uniref:CAP-Gly domain-containing protein n=1 Tax=Aphanomyces astaci TaxID=112090 RepID=A0A418D6P7_APHAT|nr:hypothetical protein DYB35_004344 [Aphanomyces astaci]
MEVGSRVLVVGGKNGTVRFLGTTDFAQGEWVGVELDVPEGKNDGEINGVRYFTCEPLYGLFAKKSQVRLARVSLGYGAANPVAAPSSSTSRLQQMREKRTSSTSNLLPPSSAVPVGGKKTIPKVDLSPKLVSTSTPHKAAASRSTSVSSPKPSSAATSPAVATGPDEMDAISMELQDATAKLQALQAELVAKNIRITELEAKVTDVTSALAAAAPSPAPPSIDDDDNSTPPPSVPVHEADLPSSPRINYEEKLRSLRDEGIALAAKMRRDMDISMTKMEKEWEDKEAHYVAAVESAEARLAALDTEVLGLRTRNAALVAAELARADDVVQWTKKLGSASRKVETQAATIADLQDMVELLTLDKETLAMDKEIADERIDELEAQIATASLMVHQSSSALYHPSTDNSSSSVATTIQDENAKLRHALLGMHERHALETATLTKQVKDAAKVALELEQHRDEIERVNAKLNQSNAAMEELKEMLDAAGAYESMVETLTETNLMLGDKVADLTMSVASLESLKDMSDEMEHQHDMYAKALQDELGAANQKIAELMAAAAAAATAIQDKDRTISRFRDVVGRHRDEVAALREKLRVEAGELESMKDTTQSVMSQSMQLRQALLAAQASNLDARRQKLSTIEMAVEYKWWQSIVPATAVLQESDRRQLLVRKMALRVTAKSRWLLKVLVPAVLEPPTRPTSSFSPTTTITDDEPSSTSTPVDHHHQAAVALALWQFRQGVCHVMTQLHATTVDTKWQELLALLDNSWTQVDSLLDAALGEWSAEGGGGALSAGTDLQPGVGARLVHAVKDWLRLIGPKLEPLPSPTIGSVKLVVLSQAFQLALQSKSLGDAELALATWQLYARVAAELVDDGPTTDSNDDVPAAGTHAQILDQLNVLVAYSKSVTSIAPFTERVKAWTKLVAKGALVDAVTPESAEDKQVVVPLHELRAELIRTDLAHAASLLTAVEETTELCHTLQARLKEAEKSDGHARMLIAKHETEIARLEVDRVAQLGIVEKLSEQLETERRQCDALLTEQHKDRAALEATNRTLRKSLRRASELHVKAADGTTASNGGQSTFMTAGGAKALLVLQEQLLAVRTELALARLPLSLSPKPPRSTRSSGLASVSHDVAALTSKILTRSAMPELVDLTKTHVQNDVHVIQLLQECDAVKATVSQALDGVRAAAVAAGEVWFTGRSCAPLEFGRTCPPKKPVGRLIFPGPSSNDDDGTKKKKRVLSVVLNSTDMHVLSKAISLA